MNKIIRAVLRLFVIYTIFIVINQIPYAIGSVLSIWKSLNDPSYTFAQNLLQVILSFVPFIITWVAYIAFLVIVWTRSDKLSEYIANKVDPSNSINININYDNLIKIALITLASYIIIMSIPELISPVLSAIILKNRYPVETANLYNTQNVIKLISTIIKVAISVLVIKFIGKLTSFINTQQTEEKLTKN